MRKTLTATIVALISTPALANSGHILQVHHGADCVEFALVEDANTKWGPNVYIGGTLNPECTALIPHSPDEAAFFKRPRGNSGLSFSELWGIERGRDGGPGG